MEIFRPVVDRKVLEMNVSEFSKEARHSLQQILNVEIVYDGKHYTVNNAISVYVKNVIDALETGDVSVIKIYDI